jgi:PAS domain S-box-containing protein
VPDGRPDRKCGFPVQPRAAGARCAGPAWQVIGENNRDLHNLMESMSIAMVFLDRDLRITFYTPAAVALFRFIPTDVGRPLANLAPRFEYPGLLEDARGVLEKLVPIEREVRDERRWLLARVQPCPSPDHRIAGVVLTFTDVTERRDAEIARLDGALAVETRVRHLEAALSALPDAICTFDAQRRLVHANEPARRFWGLGRDGYVGRTLPELGCRSRLAGALDRELQGVLAARLPRRGSLRMDEAEAGAGCIDFGFAPAGGVSADASLVVGWLRERASCVGPRPRRARGSTERAALGWSDRRREGLQAGPRDDDHGVHRHAEDARHVQEGRHDRRPEHQLDEGTGGAQHRADDQPAAHVGRQPLGLLPVVAPGRGALVQVAARDVAEQPGEEEVAVQQRAEGHAGSGGKAVLETIAPQRPVRRRRAGRPLIGRGRWRAQAGEKASDCRPGSGPSAPLSTQRRPCQNDRCAASVALRYGGPCTGTGMSISLAP